MEVFKYTENLFHKSEQTSKEYDTINTTDCQQNNFTYYATEASSFLFFTIQRW